MSAYSDALLRAERAMLSSSARLRPPPGRTLADRSILVGGSRREQEPMDEAKALVRARAAAHLVTQEYTICRDRHDRLLDESDRILDACECLEARIAAAEGRLASACQTHYRDGSARQQGGEALPNSGNSVSDACEAVIPSRKHLRAFEQWVRARHLAGLADTISCLQAASYQADAHGEGDDIR